MAKLVTVVKMSHAVVNPRTENKNVKIIIRLHFHLLTTFDRVTVSFDKLTILI